MSTTATAALSMKLLIDRKAQRVLFAEASKEVVDFLFSLLALPVATAVKLVGKEAMVGCVGNLYASVGNLYMQGGAAKDALLSPTVLSPATTTNSSLRLQPKSFYRCAFNSGYNSSCRNYITDEQGKACPHCGCSMMAGVNYLSSVQPKSFYRCDYNSSSCRNYITDVQGKACPSCGNSMTAGVNYLPSAGASGSVQVEAQSAAKGFVQGIVTYTVLDDLTVTPMSAISSITLLNTFAVRDLGDLQEKNVQLGYNEGLAILKASLQSKTVLTDVFLHGRATRSRA